MEAPIVYRALGLGLGCAGVQHSFKGLLKKTKKEGMQVFRGEVQL